MNFIHYYVIYNFAIIHNKIILFIKKKNTHIINKQVIIKNFKYSFTCIKKKYIYILKKKLNLPYVNTNVNNIVNR